MNIKILLADDHNLVRSSLARLLENEIDFHVVGETDNGRETVKLAKELSPDIIIMDIGMPELNGIEATKQILQVSSNTKIIALSMHSDKQFVTGMFKAGASGYLLKDCAFDELIDAIYTVQNKRVYISKEISGIVISEMIGSTSKDSSELSDREKEVLQLLVEGKSTKEIASILHLSIKTIESHRKNIMTKLELYTIPELTKYAVRMGITSLQ